MKTLAVITLAAVVSAIGLTTSASRRPGAPPSGPAAAPPTRRAQKVREVRPDPPGTVRGADNPAAIPDKVAYLMLFRLVANRESEVDKARLRDYFKQLGVGLGARKCPECPQKGLDAADADVLVATVNEFQRQVSDVDRQSQAMKERHHPDHSPLTPEEKVLLAKFNERRDNLINETVRALRKRLSPDGWAKLQFHIHERVKRNVKLHPGPDDAPGTMSAAAAGSPAAPGSRGSLGERETIPGEVR